MISLRIDFSRKYRFSNPLPIRINFAALPPRENLSFRHTYRSPAVLRDSLLARGFSWQPKHVGNFGFGSKIPFILATPLLFLTLSMKESCMERFHLTFTRGFHLCLGRALILVPLFLDYHLFHQYLRDQFVILVY